MGNLTRDPELRYAPNGTAVTTFTLAMSRAFNTNTGEKKEDVCFVRVVCWAKLAQICSEYLFKGRPVFCRRQAAKPFLAGAGRYKAQYHGSGRAKRAVFRPG